MRKLLHAGCLHVFTSLLIFKKYVDAIQVMSGCDCVLSMFPIGRHCDFVGAFVLYTITLQS